MNSTLFVTSSGPRRFLSTLSLAAVLPLIAACSGGGAPLAPSSGTAPKASRVPVPISGTAIDRASATPIHSPPGKPSLAPVTTTSPTAQRTASLKKLSATGAGTALFSDDFESGNANAWSLASNDWSVCAVPGRSQALCASNSYTSDAFAGSTSWTDYAASTTVDITQIPEDRSGVDIVVRALDAQHFYELELVRESDGSHQWEIWRSDNGSWTNLARGYLRIDTNTPYVLRLEAVGTLLTASISRDASQSFTTLGSATDDHYASGGTGVRAWGGMLGSFDDVTVVGTTGTPVSASAQQPQTSGAYVAPPGTQPYPSGPFNAPVNNPQYDGNSGTYLNHILGDNHFQLGKLQFSTNASGPTDNNVPVYLARDSDPSYTVHCVFFTQCPLEGERVHIPRGAAPSGRLGYTSFTEDGSHDQHLAVRNLDSQTEFDMWITPLPNGSGGTLNVGYGAKYPFSSGGYDQPGAATAAGFSLSQGRIRPVDLLAGRIPNALFLVTPCENGHVWPASGDDNGGFRQGCPPIGAHLWLDSSPNEIANSGAAPDFKVILNALHEYGGYVGDRCGSCSLSVALEGGVSYTSFNMPNPWAQIAAHFPDQSTAGAYAEYHISLTTGNIDLAQHLHVLTP